MRRAEDERARAAALVGLQRDHDGKEESERLAGTLEGGETAEWVCESLDWARGGRREEMTAPARVRGRQLWLPHRRRDRKDLLAGKHGGDGLPLDGRRFCEALSLQNFQQALRERRRQEGPKREAAR